MPVLAILLWVITHAPDLIRLVREIIELLKGLPRGERREALRDLKDAYKDVKETGDTTKLTDVHTRLCHGGMSGFCTGTNPSGE